MRKSVQSNLSTFSKSFPWSILDANDHVEYDSFEDDNSLESAFPRDKGTTSLKVIQNPYYGGEIDTRESESINASSAAKHDLTDNIKVTQNPYYAWYITYFKRSLFQQIWQHNS